MKKWIAFIGIIALLPAGFGFWWVSRFDPLIREYSEKYQLDFYLVKSLIWEESGFDPSARGKSGEFGLMQIMPYVGEEFWTKGRKGTASKYDPNRLLEARHNIEVGCWYLRSSLDLYSEKSNPLPYALARYNAGHSRVSRWMKEDGEDPSDFIARIDFPSTRAYVQRVLERSERRSSIYLW